MFRVHDDVAHAEYIVESTILALARTGQFTSGLRTGFQVAPSIGLSVQF